MIIIVKIVCNVNIHKKSSCGVVSARRLLCIDIYLIDKAKLQILALFAVNLSFYTFYLNKVGADIFAKRYACGNDYVVVVGGKF